MGNNNSVHFSRKSSRSGSVNNPKEYIIQGRIQRKNSNNNLRLTPLDNDMLEEIDSERSSQNASPRKLMNLVSKRSFSFSREKVNESDETKIEKVSNIVEHILNCKNSNNELNNQLNNFVYEIYGLSEEDIKIVEES